MFYKDGVDDFDFVFFFQNPYQELWQTETSVFKIQKAFGWIMPKIPDLCLSWMILRTKRVRVTLGSSSELRERFYSLERSSAT